MSDDYEYREIGERYDMEISDLADEITALRARLEVVEKERDQAIIAMSEQARKRGEAEGALAASEMAGIVQGWMERAERAEAALATARRDAEPYIIKIGPDHGVCVGGRWDSWLFHKHADGHWVSQQKLASESLSSTLANEAET